MDWLRFLPDFVRRHLSNSPNRQEILANSGWLISDRFLRLVVGLFVTALVARYLGPQRFGLLSYAVAFASLFGVIAGLGLENIVIRELVRRPDDEPRILGTVLFLQFTAGLLTWGSVIAVVAMLPDRMDGAFWLTVIVAASFVFHSARIVEFYFRSRVEGRHIVLAKVIPFIIVSTFKILLVVQGAGLVAFAVAFTLEAALEAVGLSFMYRRKRGKMTRFRFDADVARRTLSESWPLLLSGLSVMVYMRIDQIMLGQMRSSGDVGLYAAAVRISEVWYFIPLFLAQSAFPAIVRSREESDSLYMHRLQNLFTATCVISYSMILVLMIFSRPIVIGLFGKTYSGSAMVVALHVWAGLFVGMGFVQTSWFINEGLTRISFYRTFLGALLNVGLNIFLIPTMGIKGAAIATVVSYALAGMFANLLLPVTRPIFRMQLKGLVCLFNWRRV